VVELVDTLAFNEYNYTKACQRLRKHTLRAIQYGVAAGCEKMVVVNTGDILNSDRRLDEMVTNAGNRSKALIVACDIVQQVLMELAQFFELSYVTVGGNEARKHEELTWSNKTFSNNYDLDVHYILERLLEGTNISFKPVVDSFEQVIEVNGQHILCVHGHQLKSHDIESSINKVYAKYAKSGQLITYVICGHIHSTYNSDFFSRSGSLVGDNSYSNNCLLTLAKASQNLFIVRKNGIDVIAVDLQDASDLTGYFHNKQFAQGSGQMKSRVKADKNIRRSVISI
jgi:predicted phosphodiesterase